MERNYERELILVCGITLLKLLLMHLLLLDLLLLLLLLLLELLFVQLTFIILVLYSRGRWGRRTTARTRLERVGVFARRGE